MPLDHGGEPNGPRAMRAPHPPIWCLRAPLQRGGARAASLRGGLRCGLARSRSCPHAGACSRSTCLLQPSYISPLSISALCCPERNAEAPQPAARQALGPLATPQDNVWIFLSTNSIANALFVRRAHGVVASHPLRMRKALGSNPSVSSVLIFLGLGIFWCGFGFFGGALRSTVRRQPQILLGASCRTVPRECHVRWSGNNRRPLSRARGMRYNISTGGVPPCRSPPPPTTTTTAPPHPTTALDRNGLGDVGHESLAEDGTPSPRARFHVGAPPSVSTRWRTKPQQEAQTQTHTHTLTHTLRLRSSCAGGLAIVAL